MLVQAVMSRRRHALQDLVAVVSATGQHSVHTPGCQCRNALPVDAMLFFLLVFSLSVWQCHYCVRPHPQLTRPSLCPFPPPPPSRTYPRNLDVGSVSPLDQSVDSDLPVRTTAAGAGGPTPSGPGAEGHGAAAAAGSTSTAGAVTVASVRFRSLRKAKNDSEARSAPPSHPRRSQPEVYSASGAPQQPGVGTGIAGSGASANGPVSSTRPRACCTSVRVTPDGLLRESLGIVARLEAGKATTDRDVLAAAARASGLVEEVEATITMTALRLQLDVLDGLGLGGPGAGACGPLPEPAARRGPGATQTLSQLPEPQPEAEVMPLAAPRAPAADGPGPGGVADTSTTLASDFMLDDVQLVLQLAWSLVPLLGVQDKGVVGAVLALLCKVHSNVSSALLVVQRASASEAGGPTAVGQSTQTSSSESASGPIPDAVTGSTVTSGSLSASLTKLLVAIGARVVLSTSANASGETILCAAREQRLQISQSELQVVEPGPGTQAEVDSGSQLQVGAPSSQLQVQVAPEAAGIGTCSHGAQAAPVGASSSIPTLIVLRLWLRWAPQTQASSLSL
jgi:hypothetical protein